MHESSAEFLVATQRLTLAAAQAAVDAAIAAASSRNLTVTVAVLDSGGDLLHLSRMDGASTGTADVAIAKARCAVKFRRPTKEFADAYRSGSTALTSLPNLIVFEGGIPIILDDAVLGAIGASGASPELDGAVASAGLDAIMQKVR